MFSIIFICLLPFKSVLKFFPISLLSFIALSFLILLSFRSFRPFTPINKPVFTGKTALRAMTKVNHARLVHYVGEVKHDEIQALFNLWSLRVKWFLKRIMSSNAISEMKRMGGVTANASTCSKLLKHTMMAVLYLLIFGRLVRNRCAIYWEFLTLLKRVPRMTLSCAS